MTSSIGHLDKSTSKSCKSFNFRLKIANWSVLLIIEINKYFDQFNVENWKRVHRHIWIALKTDMVYRQNQFRSNFVIVFSLLFFRLSAIFHSIRLQLANRNWLLKSKGFDSYAVVVISLLSLFEVFIFRFNSPKQVNFEIQNEIAALYNI